MKRHLSKEEKKLLKATTCAERDSFSLSHHGVKGLMANRARVATVKKARDLLAHVNAPKEKKVEVPERYELTIRLTEAQRDTIFHDQGYVSFGLHRASD